MSIHLNHVTHFSPNLLSKKIWRGLLYTLILLAALSLLKPRQIQAANPDGDLRIEVMAAPNFIVDSNVESPSTYAPESATIGAKFCNDGADPLVDVFGYIGNFDPNGDLDASDSTPGIYPSRTHAGLTGTFSLVHEGGTAGTQDARRYVGTLAPGACQTQYWVLSYPRLDDNGNTVTGGVKPDDDLWLEYDVWATAVDAGTPLVADQTTRATMRNEISAAANKIWPNGDNKVPDVYKDAISEVLGWDTITPSGDTAVYPGDSAVLKGVWYDLGNVGAGFDNNGDLIPDKNAWVQPVGDPANYDPGCFRLVRTYGIVIVKLKGGGEYLIPFVDQLYFENIPDNTGAVGLVFYEYAALDGVCRASLTPYQEVASGFDNEKFNGDYGVSMPPVVSHDPTVTLDKQVDQSVIGPTLPVTLTYTLAIANSGPVDVGDPGIGLPLVIEEAIPANTSYITGTAAISNTLPAGVGSYTILYSADNGNSWSQTEPPAATVTNIQWWLSDSLAAGASGDVTFQVEVPAGYTGAIVPNTAQLSFGFAPPFAEDTAVTRIAGINQIGDTVFTDDGSGGGSQGNGVQDGSEAGIPGITVSLYYDEDGDGVGDYLLETDTTDGSGNYLFAGLADGRYVVEVDPADAALPTGYAHTTETSLPVSLDVTNSDSNPVIYLDADIGFSPALILEKNLTSLPPAYEGQEVTYSIDVTNAMPDGSFQPEYWATAAIAGSEYEATVADNANNVIGEPDNVVNSQHKDWPEGLVYAGMVKGTGFQVDSCGSIVKVEALYQIELNVGLDDDFIWGTIRLNGMDWYNFTVDPATAIANYATPGGGLLAIDITSSNTLHTGSVTDWATWDNAPANEVQLGIGGDKETNADKIDLLVDAIGVRITNDGTSCTEFTSDTVLNPVPLSDSYDPAKLTFVSADVAPTTVDGGTGTITWNNVGPISPGETKTINLTFEAQEPTGNFSETITNTAVVNNATFINGQPANDATDDAVTTLNPTGSIAGSIWSEGIVGTTGWAAPNGMEAGDFAVPGATIELYGCTNGAGTLLDPATVANRACTSTGGAGNNGTWELLASTTTDASGDYLFDGLLDGFYTVLVDTSTLPGTVTQTAEAGTLSTNQTSGGRTCGTCDNRWGDPTQNLNTTNFNPINTVGEDITNVNFGYTVNPAIYGTIWEDSDGDGTREVGEESLGAGITITLTDNLGNTTTTLTLSDGSYEFANLTAGRTYTVTVSVGTLPGTGWSNTADPDATIDSEYVVGVLSAGEISGSHDFGYHQTGTAVIGDTICYDWDGDGRQLDGEVCEAGEEGIPGITVTLYEDSNGDGVLDTATDAIIASDVTDIDGNYSFTTLPPGDYIVVTEMPANTIATGDPDESGQCSVCDLHGASTGLAAGITDNTVDFGFIPLSSNTIGDTVWLDINGDGAQSGVQEVGLANITVQLWADLNGDGTYELVRTAITDADGNYLFENLPDGAYQVIVDLTDPDLPEDGIGNAYVPTTNDQFDVTLSGGSYLDADFGFASLGAIGDTIYWDANGDGEYDWNEAGIPGVVITLTNALTQTLVIDGVSYAPGAVITTETTDANGRYLFEALSPAQYGVTVGSISGSPVLTGDPEADGVPCTDAGAVGCDGTTTVTIRYGTSFMGADFGYQAPGAFGDYVWFDQNGDGVPDSGEIGISGLVVTATTSADVTVGGINYPIGTTITTTTDYDGYYSFDNLISNGSSATWTVTVETPASMSPTFDADPTADASTTVVIDTSGVVTAVGGDGCTNCALNVDFGFEMNGPYALNGSVCLEADTASNRVCGDGTDAAVGGYLVYLYNDGGMYLGSTVTDASGNYSFSNLVDDIYYVVIGNTLPPLDTAAFVTTAADTPATNITDNGSSVYQTVSVNATSAANDGGVDVDAVEAVDFAYLSTVDYDFGDLPQSYNTTLEGNPSGPRHEVPTTPTLYLGDLYPDSELNGVPDAAASSDGSDEDGVTPIDIQNWSDGANGGSVSVDVAGDGWLVGWIDFNGDGDLTDSGEKIIDEAVSTGNHTFTFDIPAGTMSGSPTDFYGRFRLFSEQPPFSAFSYSGPASDGEVEDYNWLTSENPVIGIAKRLVDVSGNGDGSYTVTYGMVVENLGDVILQSVQVTDTLSTTFAGVTSYAVSGLSSDLFTVNSPSYDGSSDVNLLAGTDSLALGTTAQITLTVVITPGGNLGAYNNATFASGDSPGGTPTQDPSDNGIDPDPDGDGNPDEAGENDPTPLQFAAVNGHIFEDTNGNGTQDLGEPDLQNVDVVIIDVNGNTQTVTTDANGDYTAVVPAGDTTADVDETTLPAGYAQTAGIDPTMETAVAGNTTDIGTDGYQPPSLSVDKLLSASGDEDSSGTISVGDTLTYTITATNTGSSILNNVTVSDNLTGQSNSCSTVAPSATCVLIASYTVTQTDVDAGQIDNIGTADSDETSPVNDTHTEPVQQNPALTLDKRLFGYADEDGSGTVSLNDVLTYTFTTTNTGNVTLTGVTIVDPLSGLSALTCDQAQPANLAVGSTLNCTATYTVTQADVDAGLINNTATADSDQIGPETDSESVTVPQGPALILDKTLFGYADEDGSGTVSLNDVLTYTFTTTNTGNVTLTGVTIVDPLSGLSALTCDQAQPATLAVGSTLNCTATYTVTQTDVDAGVINNTATADSAQTGPETDSESVTVPQGPALILDKTLFGYADEDGSSTVSLNDVLTYTFTTTNTGNVMLTGVTIADPLPGLSALTCDQAQPATLAVGTTLNCTATYTVTQADVDTGQIDNTATADSNETSPVDDTHNEPVPQNPDLTVVKALTANGDEDGSSTISIGDTLTYTITATNSGDITLNNVTVEDDLTGQSTSCATVAPSGTCVLTATHTVTQTDVDTGQIDNTGTAGSNETSPVDDTHSEPVPQNPALTVVKVLTANGDEDGSGTISVGDTLTYTITATNSGDVTLNNVTVDDDLTGQSTSCATVAPNVTCVLTATYTVTQIDADAGQINNTGTAVSDETSPVDDTHSEPVPQNPALALDKALFGYADEDGSGTVSLNDVLTYTFTTTNTGNVTLTGVTINDPLPGLSALTCDQAQPATLAVGSALTCTATYTVTQADVDARQIDNTATADSNETSPVDDTHSEPVLQNASLGDFVWLDLDADGVQDAGEPGLANVTVNLYTSTGNFVDTTNTDGNGSYAFTNLVPGSYYVEFVLPSGYAFTYANSGVNDAVDSDANPVNGQTAVFNLTSGENELTWDAGLYQTLRLGNRVWLDANNNGLLDSGEQGLPNVLLELLDGSSNPVITPINGQPMTAVTDGTGRYVFDSLPAGEYIVRVAEANFDEWTDPLYGFVSSRSNAATDPAVDPDNNNSDTDDNGRNNPDPANGGIVSYPMTLTVGGEPTNEGSDEDSSYANADSNLTVDFGFFERLTLGNTIWHDSNEDGVIDSGEPGVSGVVVYLLDGNGDPVLHPVTNQPISTVTNSSGFYQFTNLYPGNYRVLVGPENFQAGGALEGAWSSLGAADPNNNSDIDDNGLDEVEPWLTGIMSESVRLDYHQEPDNNDDTDDNDNTNLTIDMGFVATPTAVTLTSFTATSIGNQQVRINWVTASEVDNFGFRIYRSSSNSFDSATEIHFEPTALLGGSGPGASYSYIDTVPADGTYYYWLEDVETEPSGPTIVREPPTPITVNVTPLFNLYLPFIIGGN